MSRMRHVVPSIVLLVLAGLLTGCATGPNESPSVGEQDVAAAESEAEATGDAGDLPSVVPVATALSDADAKAACAWIGEVLGAASPSRGELTQVEYGDNTGRTYLYCDVGEGLMDNVRIEAQVFLYPNGLSNTALMHCANGEVVGNSDVMVNLDDGGGYHLHSKYNYCVGDTVISIQAKGVQPPEVTTALVEQVLHAFRGDAETSISELVDRLEATP